jgi:hypothetical protein
MKIRYLIGLAILSLTIYGCVSEVPKINYDQASIDLMAELTPQLVGTWNLRQVNLKYHSYNHQSEIGIRKDTTFQNFGTLTVARSTQQFDPRKAEFEGTIQFDRKTYPVKFYLVPYLGYLDKRKGPQAFFMFQYNFKVHETIGPDIHYLEYLGLVNDNFDMEILPGQKKMLWRGMNRGLERIELEKK